MVHYADGEAQTAMTDGRREALHSELFEISLQDKYREEIYS